MMPKFYLFTIVFILCTIAGYGQLFRQDFQSSTTLATYENAAPSNGQFTSIAPNNANVSITATSNRLNFTRTGNGKGAFSRSVGFSPAPTSLMIRMDISVTGNSNNQNTQGELFLGTNTTGANSFTDNTNSPSNGNTYAKIGIGWTSTSGEWFVRDISNSTSGATQTGTQTLLWVVNKSGATLYYRAPDGTNESIANNRADVWVGTVKEMNDIAVESTSVTGIDKTKFIFAGNNGTMSLDNIQYDPIPPTPASSIPTGTAPASFTANWTASTGVTGYRIDVSTNPSFSSFVSGYNNLYIPGQATNSLNVTGLAQNTTYYYRVRSASQYSIAEYASGNSTVQFTNTVLPVTLGKFQAYQAGGRIELVWSTASESGSRSFEIERSSTGREFIRIGEVDSKGTGRSYAFNDYASLNGKNYYRLRMIDKDGSFTYSPIVEVNSQISITINVYPNPASQTLTLRYPMADKNSRISLLTLDGSLINVWSVKDHTDQINIPLNGLRSANYIVVLDNGHKKTSAMFTKK